MCRLGLDDGFLSMEQGAGTLEPVSINVLWMESGYSRMLCSSTSVYVSSVEELSIVGRMEEGLGDRCWKRGTFDVLKKPGCNVQNVIYSVCQRTLGMPKSPSPARPESASRTNPCAPTPMKAKHQASTSRASSGTPPRSPFP